VAPGEILLAAPVPGERAPVLEDERVPAEHDGGEGAPLGEIAVQDERIHHASLDDLPVRLGDERGGSQEDEDHWYQPAGTSLHARMIAATRE